MDEQATQLLGTLGTPSNLDQVTDDLLKQALKPHAEIGVVYKAILFADARAWARGETGLEGDREAISLGAVFAKFKAPRTYESLKAMLLVRSTFFGTREIWEAAKLLEGKPPTDELVHLSYLEVRLGFDSDPSVDSTEVKEEAARLLSLHPNYLGLMEISAIAEVQDGMTHPDRKVASLTKAREGFKAYIAKAHPEAFHSQLAAWFVKKLDQALDNK